MMKRLFIAIDLAIPVVERLVGAQGDLRARFHENYGEDVILRLVAPENIHVTLKFLGDQPEELESMIIKVLEKLSAPLFPFEVECLQIGAFPEPKTARILWAGLDEESSEVLRLLQRALERDLEDLGIPREEREFLPHVTLARVKSEKGIRKSDEILASFEGVTFGKSFVKDLVLFSSTLTPEGSRYEVVRRFSLGR